MDQNKICRICGDRANCFNYSGLPSCPACRIFFLRHSPKYDKLSCLKRGKCEIDFVTRKCCIKCRLDKCFEIGMVLRSRQEKKIAKLKFELENEYEHTDSDTTILENGSNGKVLPKPLSTRVKRSLKLNEIESQQIAIIENAFKVFEEENQLPVVGEENFIKFMSNLSTVYSTRAVTFCKKIPVFASLSQVAQLSLLKSFCFEALLIRVAFQFDKNRIEFCALKDESGKEAILIKFDMILPPQYAHLHEQNTQIVARLNEAMENDAQIRNMLIILNLVKPFTDNQNCIEYLRYHYFVFRYLFRRYLEDKYGNAQAADRKFNLLMNLIETDFQIAKENCRSVLIVHGVDQVADLVAEVMSI